MSQAEHPKGALRTGNIADELAQGQKDLEVIVVSPARPIFEGDAHWVTVPAWSTIEEESLLPYGDDDVKIAVGQIGIWPGHAPLVAALGSGLLRIGQGAEKVARFAVRGGFLKVGGSKVTILVDHAVAEGEVDVAQVKKELEETLAALRHPKSDAEFEDLLDLRTWGEARLKLAEA